MNKLHILPLVVLLAYSVRAQNDLMNVSLEMPTVAARPGDEICLDVTSADFNGIFGLSFTILFDPTALEFKQVSNLSLPGATLDLNFNTLLAGEGKIAMLWTNLGSDAYPKPYRLFSLCFKVLGTTGSIVPVTFANDPVPVEIIGDFGPLSEDFVQGRFTNGAVWIRSGALPPLPEISGETTVFSCGGAWKAGVDLSVSGGAVPYQYQWSGPNGFTSTEEDLPILNFGVYSVTVTDQNQTPAFASFYLVRPQSIGTPVPIISGASITPATNCNNPDGAIALNLNQDAALLTFQWSNGATTPQISGLLPGTYEVSIVDEKGCTGQWSGKVSNANDFNIAVTAQPAVCTQSAGRLQINSPTGQRFQYTWFDGSRGSVVEGLLPGSYGLTVTDANTGCVKTAQTTVATQGSIPLTISTVQPDCKGTPGSITLQLPNAPVSIQWNTGAQAAQLSNLPAGVYTAVITDQTAGCVREESIVLRSPEIKVTIQAECRLSDSAPDSVFVTATPSGGVGPYTFQWSTGQSIVSQGASTVGAPLPAALFASVTDQEGCAGNFAPLPPCREEDRVEDFKATLFYECVGGLSFTAHVREGGVPPYNFSWSNGFRETAEQASTTVANGRNYTAVTITDAMGKTDILVGHPLPTGICQEISQQVALSVPDTIVEVDESFALPIRLESDIALEGLTFQIDWDARRLNLDGLSGQGLSLGNSLEDANLRGHVLLTFDLSRERPGEGELVFLQFTPKGTEEETIPVWLGYSKWQAIAKNISYPIIPHHGSVTLVPDGAKVWPGDTDQSQAVDHKDLLNIGLAYGMAGRPRPNAATTWNGQYSPAWGQTTPVSEVDYKHIDTNGDGLVNAADTLAIARNWSQTTPHVRQPGEGPQPEPKVSGTPLSVEGGTISSAQDNVLSIALGTPEQPAGPVYGLAFSIFYEGFISMQNLRIDFTDSWLGLDGKPLLAIYRHFPSERRVDVALVRTDGQGQSGFGPIAQLILRGNNRTGRQQSAILQIGDVKMIDQQEQLLPVDMGITHLTVDFSTGVEEPAWARLITVSPVPAINELEIRAEGIAVEGLQVLNLQGKVLSVYSSRRILPVNSLVPGLYLLRIQTPRGVVVRRWIKQ